MKRKRIHHEKWRIENREAPKSQWPITLVQGEPSLDHKWQDAPIWVWGDLKLAEKIVRLLNNT